MALKLAHHLYCDFKQFNDTIELIEPAHILPYTLRWSVFPATILTLIWHKVGKVSFASLQQ